MPDDPDPDPGPDDDVDADTAPPDRPGATTRPPAPVPEPPSDGGPPPPGPPGEGPGPSRWWPERSGDRYIGGVAGGIAHRLDVDPLVVRVALAVTVAYLPPLVALYAAAWLVLRDEVTGRSLLVAATEEGGRLPALGVTALGVGAVVLAPDLGPGGDTGLTVGVVLLGLGYLLVTGRVGGLPGPARPATPPAAPVPPQRDPAPPSGGPGRWWSARPSLLPRPPRPPSHLGWSGLSALAVLVGGAAAYDQAIGAVSPGLVVALGLVLVGSVLCVAAHRGRARLLLPVGLALVPLWVGLAASGVSRYDGDGAVDHTVAAGGPVPAAFRHGYGSMNVDLTHADLEPGERRTVRIGLTAGRANIHVPREAHLRLRGHVALGSVRVHDLWLAGDSGPYVLDDLDRTLGDPVPLCEGYPVIVEDPTVPTDPVDPADPAAPPVTTIEHYHVRTGEPCTPEPPTDDDPAVLELVLDVGIGEVEIHRDEA